MVNINNIDDNKIKSIGNVLNDKNRPLKERFRALFTLRNLGGSQAIECINECFQDDSALLKHELAYCLGQMQNCDAIPYLIKVLDDLKQEPMVRHEAAEALGALGSIDVIPILEKYLKDSHQEVSETCEIAIDRIRWLKENQQIDNKQLRNENPYESVDPTPPTPTTTIKNCTELRTILFNENETLFKRYQAMFSLRNLRTPESVCILGEALKSGSSLFRHEIAFVLGQLQEASSVPYLMESLKDSQENEMVRHECAEALGSIATEECIQLLNEYLNDEKQVVRESCIVALDMCEYENSPEFQYANTLNEII